jgi:hypothetical protein
MVDESSLPGPFRESLEHLRRAQGTDVRVDAVKDNWAYLWLPKIRLDAGMFDPPLERGVWVRLPLQFPQAFPHGVVTKGPLTPKDGHQLKGQNVNEGTSEPVRTFGGTCYYSWTWNGNDYGPGPRLQTPADISEVVSWIERRIRLA